MGARAREFAMENYAASAVARRYVDLFARHFGAGAVDHATQAVTTSR
jgi:hypothetical protein